MKKTLSLALAFLLLAAMVTAAPAAAAVRGVMSGYNGNMNLRKTPSTEAARLDLLKPGTEVTILSQTTVDGMEWYKIEADGKTGYVQSRYVSKATGFSVAAEPAYSVYTEKAQIVELLNYHLSILSTEVTFPVEVLSQSEFNRIKPAPKTECLYGFLISDSEREEAGQVSAVRWRYDGQTKTVTAQISYNSTGLVLKHLRDGTELTDPMAIELYEKAKSILEERVTGEMDEYERALALHDYICETTEYVDGVDKTAGQYPAIAYGALLQGKASCQGYAEATSLLYTMAGLENIIVRATSKATGVDHGYVKAKVDGRWYCVDTTGDDPVNNANPTIRHDFFLTSDEVIAQRYKPWSTGYTYPAAVYMADNYYVKNDLVVDSLKEAKSLIKKAVRAKQPALEIWVDDYSSGKYKASELKQYAVSMGAKSVSLRGLAIERSTLYFIFTY